PAVRRPPGRCRTRAAPTPPPSDVFSWCASLCRALYGRAQGRWNAGAATKKPGANCSVPSRLNLIVLRQVNKDEIPMSYENIQVETKGRVGIIRFHRPQALNALNAALVKELNAAIDR